MKKKYEAVIFDLDGVICSTDEFHYQAWKALADTLCLPFDREYNNRLRGVSRAESLELVLSLGDKSYSQDEKARMMEEKNELYRKLLGRMDASYVDAGTRNALNRIRRNFRTAIASSSRNTAFILERIGLADFFDAVIDGNCIRNSKPDPEVFLKAADALGTDPSKALVVEDAKAGIEAAKRGGFDTAGIGDASTLSGIDCSIKALEDLVGILL